MPVPCSKRALAVALLCLATALPSLAQLPPNLPFSPARWAGDLLFVSGQIGNVPGKLELVPGGIQAETRQALQNLRAILEDHEATMDDVVKCTVMMADISEWGAMNEVYVKAFHPPYPARSALGANGLALGARTEIECVAWVPGGGAKAPAADPAPKSPESAPPG